MAASQEVRWHCVDCGVAGPVAAFDVHHDGLRCARCTATRAYRADDGQVDHTEGTIDVRLRFSLRRHVGVPLFWLGSAVIIIALLVGWQVLMESSPIVAGAAAIIGMALLVGDLWLLFRPESRSR